MSKLENGLRIGTHGFFELGDTSDFRVLNGVESEFGPFVSFAATKKVDVYLGTLHGVAGDAADTDHAEEAVVVQLGDLHLERTILIDIRRPDEWATTGLPAPGGGIDMRRDDFVDALLEATGGSRTVPVALICARGVRSDRLSATLASAGFERIVDVPEGMLGSRAGPGWVARDLPVRRP